MISAISMAHSKERNGALRVYKRFDTRLSKMELKGFHITKPTMWNKA